jgi:hypothetical protein
MRLPALEALNEEEMKIGFVVGALSAFRIGWLAIVPAVASAYLWAAGGAKGEDGGNKAYRRIGVPLVWVGVVAAITHDQWTLPAWLPAFGVLSMGYGIPTTQPYDAGSYLGRFFYYRTKKHYEDKGTTVTQVYLEQTATFWTRATIYLLLAVSLFLVPAMLQYALARPR